MVREDFISPRFYYTFGPHEPTLRVPSGASLRVICPDSDNAMADGTLLSAGQRQQSAGIELFEGNPVAGPIFVEGARRGDALAVRIEKVNLDRRRGQTGLAPAHGLLPGDLLSPPRDGRAGEPTPRHLYVWDIDVTAGVARVTNSLGGDPIEVELNPFVGCIGVCPKWGQSISTLFAGDHGGNMDLPAIRPGATLLLPVHTDGGLLMMGDIHAAQGEGEIIGGAIETSGVIECTVEVIADASLPAPRLLDPRRIMAFGSDGEVRGAIQRAYGRLVDWLAGDLGMNRWDAYHLISQAGSIELGNLLAPPYVAGASLPRGVLPARASERIVP